MQRLGESLPAESTIPPWRPVPRGEMPTDKKPTRLRYVDDESGQYAQYLHPEIITVPYDALYHEQDEVMVSLYEDMPPQPMMFGEYLEIIGVESYGEYSAAVRHAASGQTHTSQDEVLRGLHQRIIEKRTRRAKQLALEYEKLEAHQDRFQEVNTKSDSAFFSKLFNDLHIDGLRALQARRREDFLDETDDFLILNPHELRGEEDDGRAAQHELYIGIQRSFNSKDIRKRWHAIPERSELKKIPVVSLKEEFEDYGDDAEGMGTRYMQQLLDVRSKQARGLGKTPKELKVPPVYKVLGASAEEGQLRQMRLVIKKLHAVRDQLVRYRSEADSSDEQIKLERYLDAIDAASAQVRFDMSSLEERA